MSKFLTALLFAIMSVVVILELAPLDFVRPTASIPETPPHGMRVLRDPMARPPHIFRIPAGVHRGKEGKFTVKKGGFTVTDANFKVEKTNFIVKDVTDIKVTNPGFKFR